MYNKKYLLVVPRLGLVASTLPNFAFSRAQKPVFKAYQRHINSKETITKRTDLTPNQARILMDNLKSLDEEAFSTDQELQKELMLTLIPPKNKPLGLVLLSATEICIICNSSLIVRSDKPSSIVVYDDNLGTVPATHYHKYCSKRSFYLILSYTTMIIAQTFLTSFQLEKLL